MLSIIIPTFNDLSLSLARKLSEQAAAMAGLDWELIVGDDGSTDRDVVAQNRAINALPHCRYVERKVNAGRAAIRNYLAREARGEWLLCVDGDARIDDGHYLEKMVAARREYSVCYGGYIMMRGPDDSLRWRYERQSAPRHTVAMRQRHPYAAFNISNLLIRRDLLLAHPLDERIRRYGYEDVALGKALEQAVIAVGHIDAPVAYYDYESNESYLRKTDESIATLWEHRDELRGYSHLLSIADTLPSLARRGLALAFRLLRPALRANLLSRHPSVRLFNAYKLGLLLSNGD